MIKKNYLVFLLVFIPVVLHAQAGKGVYNFLDLPVSSRISALGGSNVSISDNDLNFAFRNPALLSPETDKVIALNFTNYLTDINYGSAAYAMTIGEKNFLAFGIQYANYGNFEGYDEQNIYQGDFSANDIAIYLSYARPMNERFTLGATLKPIFSVYENYTSIGIAMDAGVTYVDKERLFSAGLVFRNFGTQLKGYYSYENKQHYEPLPFDIQLGATKKFAHAPLRFSLTLHNLHKWDLKYQSTNQNNTSLVDGNEVKKKDPGFFDMAFRHTIIGVDFLPHKSFYVSAGYNHRRRQELSADGFKSLAGFSFGAGVKLYKFQLGFAMTQFQAGLNSYQFSISTSLNEFRL